MSLNWAVSSPCGGGAALFRAVFSVFCGGFGGVPYLDAEPLHAYVMHNISFDLVFPLNACIVISRSTEEIPQREGV